MSKLFLLDTTIRDGELSTSFNPTSGERLDIAQALDHAGIDIIELASSADSAENLTVSRKIAQSLKNATACCLARMHGADIEIAKRLLAGSPNSRIHLYLDAKRVHAMKNNESDRQSTLAMVQSTIKNARNYFAEVEFSPQDATRADSASLAQLTATAVSAGAQIINISDTTGTATADQIKNLITALFEAVPELSNTLLSLHGHNHFKRATSNALAAISHGVRQIECTINGVGPAGGNTDLIDVVEQLSRPGKNRDVDFAADSHLLQALGNQTCFR